MATDNLENEELEEAEEMEETPQGRASRRRPADEAVIVGGLNFPGIIISAMFILVEGWFFLRLKRTQLIPAKYMWLIGGALVIFAALVAFLCWNYSRKGRYISGAVTAMVLCTGLIVGASYVDRAYNTLRNLEASDADGKTVNWAVFVRSGDTAQSLDDIKNDPIGILEFIERDKADIVLGEIMQKVKSGVSVKTYTAPILVVEGLLNGEVRSILIEEDSLGVFSGDENILQKVRKLSDHPVERDVTLAPTYTIVPVPDTTTPVSNVTEELQTETPEETDHPGTGGYLPGYSSSEYSTYYGDDETTTTETLPEDTTPEETTPEETTTEEPATAPPTRPPQTQPPQTQPKPTTTAPPTQPTTQTQPKPTTTATPTTTAPPVTAPGTITVPPGQEGRIFTVYIAGMDSRSGWSSRGNTDVNILACVNMNTHQILLINTPRDYYVPFSVADGRKDKLTHAGYYGVQSSMDTLQMLYKVKSNYYVRVFFEGFVKFIDAIGGINVYSEYAFKAGSYYFNQGNNYIDGSKALFFVRERESLPGGDNARGRNQMAVIKGVVQKAASGAITNFDSVLNTVSGLIDYSIPYDLISMMIRSFLNGDKWNVATYAVTGTGGNDWCFSINSNNYVMYPNYGTVEYAQSLIYKLYNGEAVNP